MIALAMIVAARDEEAPLLEKCLKSAHKYVDGIFINLNHKKGQKPSELVGKVCGKYGATVKLTVWEGNFAKARNESFGMVPDKYTHILWLDADDTLENGKKLKKVLNVGKDADGFYFKYNYAHDEFGNVTVSHYVARVVKNNGAFIWKSSFNDEKYSVHETLAERRKHKAVSNEEVWVDHHASEDRRDNSLERNIDLLEKMLKAHNETPDPRILYYLATHYIDANRIDEAQELLEDYVRLSGWKDERAYAFTYLGRIHKAKNHLGEAKHCFLLALGENPKDPNPYIQLGELEYDHGLYETAIVWLEMGALRKVPITSIVLRPMDHTFKAYLLLAKSHANIGGKSLKLAQGWLEKAKELRPKDPEMLHIEKVILGLVETQQKILKVKKQLKKLLDTNISHDAISQYLDSLPQDIQDNPFILSAKREFAPPNKWPKKSIAIFCGGGPLGIWGPWSLVDGIGGSEEAVVRLSKQLINRGWKVVVYATPGERAGTYDGVEYKQYWEFNSKDEFDVLVAWRCPWFFDKKYKARKSYLWMHDVMERTEFFPERLANLDKVILLSRYHRSCFPEILEEKVFYSGNGIDPEDFEKVDNKYERDPHRMIYMSSHVRGLDLVYTIWPDVIKAVPDAKLDVYYGWGSFDAIHRDNPERMAWKQAMVAKAETLEGVTDHGKVGQDIIVQEIQKSGVWVYPCPFPEIYCITAIKAQAGGAVPVSSNFAALDETVQFGTKIPMKQLDEKTPVGDWDSKELTMFKTALIDMLSNPQAQELIRPKMMDWARTQSWDNVARSWIEEFND